MADDEGKATPATDVPGQRSGAWRSRWLRVGGELIGLRRIGTSSWRGSVTNALVLLVIGVATWVLGLHGLWAVPDWLEAEPAPAEWHLVTLGVATLAVMFQRLHPAVAYGVMAAMVVADMVLGGSVGMLIVLWEFLLGAGLSRNVRVRRVMAGVVAAIVLAAAVTVLIVERDLQHSIVTGIQFLALLALPLWWAANVRQKTELADLEARRAADLERIGELRRAEAVQAERSAIARDLHDAIASRLSTIAIRTAAGISAAQRDQDATLRVARSQALEALREMRSMIVVLRSEPHRSMADTSARVVGGLENLDELVSSARAAGLRVEVDVPSQWTATETALPMGVRQACFRIVQEALANAIKHAPDSEVRVAVSGDESEARIVVVNSLTGTAAVDHPTLSAGTGLVTMRERAEALGGRFHAGWDETKSVWRVEAHLPLSTSGSSGSGERTGTAS